MDYSTCFTLEPLIVTTCRSHKRPGEAKTAHAFWARPPETFLLCYDDEYADFFTLCSIINATDLSPCSSPSKARRKEEGRHRARGDHQRWVTDVRPSPLGVPD